MRSVDLAIKDLAQIFRDRRSLLFLIAMPIAFTIFMGFIYSSGKEDEPPDRHLSLAWVKIGPAGRLSQLLYAHLEESPHVKILEMEQDAALVSLREGDVDGVLLIPAGFGERADGSLQGGKSGDSPAWQIKLVTDPYSIKGVSLYQLLKIPLSQLKSAAEISQLTTDKVGDPTESYPALEQAWDYWGKQNLQNLVRVERSIKQEPESWFGDNPYNQASPGILVQFAIMGLVTSSQILARERKSRTLQRLMTTALKPWEILLGHLLAMFFVVFLQTVLLIIFGQLILDVRYLQDPVSVLLVSVALGLWVSSMGLMIGLIAKDDEQVILYAMVAMFFFSGLGGAWFPLDTAGRVFAAIGKVLPSAWAIKGFQNVLIHQLDIHSIWQPVSILLAFGFGFFLLSVWRFRTMEV